MAAMAVADTSVVPATVADLIAALAALPPDLYVDRRQRGRGGGLVLLTPDGGAGGYRPAGWVDVRRARAHYPADGAGGTAPCD